MRLPRLLVLTDRSQCAASLTAVVATAVDAGARAVVLREKDLPDTDRQRLADELRGILGPVDGILVVAGLLADQPSRPTHLSASDPFPPVRPTLVGRSCHDSDELDRATSEGCDYVTISPVFTTPSKPGYGPALGPTGLPTLTSGGLPAYGLGGVRPADVRSCLDAGAHGIAVMGPVMREPRITADYVAALQEVVA